MFNIENYLENINCPNCFDNSFKIIKASNYRTINNLENLENVYKSSSDDFLMDQLVECKSCDLQYLNPRINSKIILQSYEDTVDEKHTSQDKYRLITFTKSLKKIIKYLNINDLENKFFLDIGSASGVFLKAIKNFGFKEEGYEPSKWMVEYGRKNYGININQGTISNLDQNKKFDFISFWDVLEHVTDINETLRKIEKVSKQKTILIINVPDNKSFTCKLMKNSWPFYLNVHLYYFNKQTIQKVLSRYNFKLLESFPHWQYLGLGYLCRRASKHLKIFLYFEKLLNFFKLSNIPIPYNMGQTTFIFEKESE
jgi:2-polyprenyl-3-methyl-5-hydroxy-6-metoxy-1,4-benzoquinol methylase